MGYKIFYTKTTCKERLKMRQWVKANLEKLGKLKAFM
jgi:hypothetical protein